MFGAWRLITEVLKKLFFLAPFCEKGENSRSHTERELLQPVPEFHPSALPLPVNLPYLALAWCGDRGGFEKILPFAAKFLLCLECRHSAQVSRYPKGRHPTLAPSVALGHCRHTDSAEHYETIDM